MADALPGTRAAGGGGISGLGILGIVAGTVLIVSGLRGASIADTTRSLIRGQPPPRTAGANAPIGFDAPRSGTAASGGAATGQAVADQAVGYVGVPYVWAGHSPDGWDCSGFVTYVLHHDFGLDLPDNTHTVTGQFYVWDGAITVPREQCQAGDLCCWIGHIGIATGANTMVNAPGFGISTRVQDIGFGAVIRRPKAYLGGDEQ